MPSSRIDYNSSAIRRIAEEFGRELVVGTTVEFTKSRNTPRGALTYTYNGASWNGTYANYDSALSASDWQMGVWLDHETINPREVTFPYTLISNLDNYKE